MPIGKPTANPQLSRTGNGTYRLSRSEAEGSIRRMGWTYIGSGSRDEDSQGDEARVLRELAELDGQRLPWRHKWARLARWLRRR